MSIRIFCAILVLCGFSIATAQEPGLQAKAITEPDQDFLMVPFAYCKDAKYADVCKTAKLPPGMEGRVLTVTRPSMGLASFSPTNGPQDDHYELTCYRCAFAKIEKKNCGRYQDIHGNAGWAKNCPKKP